MTKKGVILDQDIFYGEEIQNFLKSRAHALVAKSRKFNISVEDLVQDTNLKIWQYLKKGKFSAESEGLESYRKWSATILRNIFLNKIKHLNSAVGDINMPVDPHVISTYIGFYEPAADEHLLSKEDEMEIKNLVDQALAPLSEYHRSIVSIRYRLQEKDNDVEIFGNDLVLYRSMVDILNMPIGTIKSALHTAHKKMLADAFQK